MKKAIAIFSALVAGQLAKAQSSVYNPPYLPYVRIQIPNVQALETDGTESKTLTFYSTNTTYTIANLKNGSGYVTNSTLTASSVITTHRPAVAVPKLSAFRTLKYCDFVLKAINHDSPGGKPLVYIYSSTVLWAPPLDAPIDGAALVYYQDVAAAWPDNVLKKQYDYLYDGDSIQDATGNAASNIEIWPSRTALASAGIKATSRNIEWTCLLLNGVDTFNDSAGNKMWFAVNVEWREKPPDYE
ncbi:MAG: hypothetical protein K9M45_01625 [Kiritimatiellales bacterium]|nr:hypothetical protein [Kiritimatiellales bacterium]